MGINEESVNVPWKVTPDKIRAVIERIIEISAPRKLILFGSSARGDVHRDSDLDVMVVTSDDIENARKESIRIRRALKGLRMPMDILVVTESKLRELGDAPGLIYREAIRYGKVVYERHT
ncbi:MAG: nucleotidyltransferase domain-containing protein [bacterium]